MTFLLAVSGMLIFVDQVSKYYVEKLILPGRSIPIVQNLFQLTLVQNPGVAFGLFRRSGPFLFIIVSILFIALFFFFLKGLSRKGLLWRLGLGLILGGALGNLIDRLRWGYVVDFLDFSLRGHHWPAFNFSDLGIITGVAILCYKMLKKSS
jgi:signal peptidase II